jgi:hypothetical protein
MEKYLKVKRDFLERTQGIPDARQDVNDLFLKVSVDSCRGVIASHMMKLELFLHVVVGSRGIRISIGRSYC